MNVLLWIGLIVLVTSILVVWVLEDQICAELRARHPDVWSALGSAERVLDDFGQARQSALERLWKNPQLLAACSPELAGRLRLMRKISKICIRGACILLVAGLAHYFRMHE